MNNLNGKKCLITGATGGLGKEIAREMNSLGCDLFLTARNYEKLYNLKNELNNAKAPILICDADLGSQEGIDKVASLKDHGLDIIINCAGIFEPKSIEESSIEDFDNCFNVNVKAPFVFCKEFSANMKDNKWGRIVNIGSSSAYNGFKDSTIYSSSKHALLGLSKSMQAELKEFNVRTFFVAPSGMKTEMGKRIKGQKYDTFIDPKEVAQYISFVIMFDGDMVADEIQLKRMSNG